jgi:hypothetical protein
MLGRIVERWRVRSSPEARRKRKAARRLAWQEAQQQADARRDRDYPRPEGFWDRVKGGKP